MHTRAAVLAGMLCLIAHTAAAADDEAYQRGKELHEENCLSCHARMFDGEASRIYTRDDRMIDSLDGLRSQVQRCESQLGLRWFEDDINAVATYLNEEYYRFEE